VLPTVEKINNLRINSEWGRAREPKRSRWRKEEKEKKEEENEMKDFCRPNQ
jgi:hypothetical protein